MAASNFHSLFVLVSYLPKMHYVRLLRPPALSLKPSGASLSLVLAITTDLREAFLSPPKPIGISIALELKDPNAPNEDKTYVHTKRKPRKTDMV